MVRSENQRLQKELCNLEAQKEELDQELVGVRSQLDTVQAENQRLQKDLGNSEARREEVNQELAQVRSQFDTERASREKIEAERVELAQFNKSELPEAADLLNQLKAKCKKSRASLTDVQKILEILEFSSHDG